MPGCKHFLRLLQAEDLRAAVQFLQDQAFKVEAILGEELGVIFWRPELCSLGYLGHLHDCLNG